MWRQHARGFALRVSFRLVLAQLLLLRGHFCVPTHWDSTRNPTADEGLLAGKPNLAGGQPLGMTRLGTSWTSSKAGLEELLLSKEE